MAKPRIRSSSTKVGHPTKCTPERMADIERLIGEGIGRRAVAQKVGIGVATLCEWFARGRAGEEPYAEMVRRVEGASDDLHDEVRTGLIGDMRSDNEHIASTTRRWMAERLWPDRYGRRSEVRTTGPDGGPVQIEAKVETTLITESAVAVLSPEQLAVALKATED